MGNILYSRNFKYDRLNNGNGNGNGNGNRIEETRMNDLLKQIPENRNLRLYLETLIDENNNLKMKMKMLEDNFNTSSEKYAIAIYNIEEHIKLIQTDLLALVKNDKILLERIKHSTDTEI